MSKYNDCEECAYYNAGDGCEHTICMYEDIEEVYTEKVDHPSHYNKGIETIDYIESWDMNFNEGNVIKYTTRAKYKENQLEDLKKAKWYIEREIQRINKGE